MTSPSISMSSPLATRNRRLRSVPRAAGVTVRMKIPTALMSVMYAKRNVSLAR